MKVYSKSKFSVDKEVPTEFDNYIGKDIWVLCVSDINDNWRRYCRFTEKDVKDFNDGRGPVALVSYNCLSFEDVNKLPNMSKAQVRNTLTKVYSDYAPHLKIVRPMSVLTKQDLDTVLGDSSEYETFDSVIDKYVGKGYWIKGRLFVSGMGTAGREVYMCPLVKRGHYIALYWIDKYYIEDHDELDPDENTYSMMHPWRPSSFHIDEIDICQPLEILTSEEVAEELDKCPEYEDYEEEYEEDEE